MAFDGITIHALVRELRENLIDQRVSKIAQPEKEELLFTFKGLKGANKLLMSANASLPLIYMTAENKQSPLTAPNFCMLLRKYIANGRITDITQPGLERVICFRIEHLDELGDQAVKYLYVEIMGKHSNIIFCNEENVILDSIKHVSSQMSSVREVLPNRTYFIPEQARKYQPFDVVSQNISKEEFIQLIFDKPTNLCKAIYTSFVGIAPIMATEIATRAGLDADYSTSAFSFVQKNALYDVFVNFFDDLRSGTLEPTIYYDKKAPKEFAPVSLCIYSDLTATSYTSVSEMLENFYAQRNAHTNIHQKSADLRKIVATHLDRDRKKYELQKKQLEDTEKKEKYRIYGEMLHTYGYEVESGAKSVTVINYYNNEELTIPLDPTLSAMENAEKYFDKYGKLKRTSEALSELILETKQEIDHLASIESSLLIAETEADLNAIREELSDFGYIKKHYDKKNKKAAKSTPLHFIDQNGFHIYVGKNNYQNDQLTFKFATGNDWWFHTKGIPGSHVIVKSEGKELPDDTFETAAALAAYYSSARDNDKVEIDYLQKKNVKKPNGAAPGFVVYYTNFSMVVAPSVDYVTLCE